MKILISQINTRVGDVDYNYEKISRIYIDNKDKVDLIIFPELVTTGYPPEDLLLSESFKGRVFDVQSKIVNLTKAPNSAGTIFGGLHYLKDVLYNSAIYAVGGIVNKVVNKCVLPNYGVFDEKRYFDSWDKLQTIEIKGKNFLILICEDLWSDQLPEMVKDLDFEKVIVINASPYAINKYRQRRNVATNLGNEMIYVNLVGGQDNLVFDGRSFVLDAKGNTKLMLKSFAEENAIYDDESSNFIQYNDNQVENIYLALLTGLRDYIHKNGFESILIGLSGGIDSALCAVIAADALGVDMVNLVKMPSGFTSKESFDDADELSSRIKCGHVSEIKIDDIMQKFLGGLAPSFLGKKEDLTEENLQSRIRGVLLMALSNKLGHLVLSTSNKSESAVGYSTLYGDMCGAYSPLKDVYKTMVYKLSKWRNDNIPSSSRCKVLNPIPENIISKEPTAELRHDQKDSDNLPEYDILDVILRKLIEKRMSVGEIAGFGIEKDVVKKVNRLLLMSEYKRRQSAIGPKISNLSFDRDRRYPITNGYKN